MEISISSFKDIFCHVLDETLKTWKWFYFAGKTIIIISLCGSAIKYL